MVGLATCTYRQTCICSSNINLYDGANEETNNLMQMTSYTCTVHQIRWLICYNFVPLTKKQKLNKNNENLIMYKEKV